MYEELVNDLRENGNNWRDPLLLKAADAIEELDAKYNKALQDLVKLANNSPKVDNRFGEWVPVAERLPKADERDARGYAVPYLVMNGWMRVTARRTKDYWVLFGVGTVLEYVTHWMPLPEPPKEE